MMDMVFSVDSVLRGQTIIVAVWSRIQPSEHSPNFDETIQPSPRAIATDDQQLIESLKMADFRVGIGHDTHRLVEGSLLRIGGVDIPFHMQLAGHSDADVLLHAITDAILGAASLGDIGEMFPDTDPANKQKNSADMLSAAAERVVSLGWKVANLDCIVHAEAPKILPHRDKIMHRISEILVLRPDQIGLKGKTGEGIGPVGEGQIIQAQCVCLLVRIEHGKGVHTGIGF